MPRYIPRGDRGGRRSDYDEGYDDGYDDAMRKFARTRRSPTRRKPTRRRSPVKKRKLSGWQKYIKNKRNHIKFKSGSKRGRLNLKAMAVKFRKTPAGRKNKR